MCDVEKMCAIWFFASAVLTVKVFLFDEPEDDETIEETQGVLLCAIIAVVLLCTAILFFLGRFSIRDSLLQLIASLLGWTSINAAWCLVAQRKDM